MLGKLKVSLVVVCVAGLAFAAGAAAAKKGFSMTYAEDEKFSPWDPKNAEGPQVSFVHGDPHKGPVAFILRTKGKAPMHSHTQDYSAVVVKGNVKHWVEGQEADAKPAAPGSFWFQPGKQVHGDSCESPDGCELFIMMPGSPDFIPAPTPKG